MSNQSIIKIVLSLVTALMLVACAGPAMLDSRHGDSIENNIQRQTVNPAAGHSDVAGIGLDGQKAEQVIKAYRKNDGRVSSSSLVNKVGN